MSHTPNLDGNTPTASQPNAGQEVSVPISSTVPEIQQPVPRPTGGFGGTTGVGPFGPRTFTYRASNAASVESLAEDIGKFDLNSGRKTPFDETDPEFVNAKKAFKAMGLIGKAPKIKVREPETYDGKKRGLSADQFIESCKLYFLVKKEEFVDDRMKIVFAISYLTDTAKVWASPILRDLLGKQKKEEARKWKKFEEEFVKAFGDPDKEAAAIRELEALVAKGQKGPATHYASDFRRITMEIEWDESTFMHYYRRGLKEEVKDALVYHPKQTSLEDLVNLSIRLDERIWERKQERNNEGSHRPPPRPQPRNPFQQQPQPPQPNHYAPPPVAPPPQIYRANPNQQAPNAFQHTQPVPIHIDANKRGPVSAEEKAKQRQEGRCYYCGQAGHRASDHNLPARPRQGVIDGNNPFSQSTSTPQIAATTGPAYNLTYQWANDVAPTPPSNLVTNNQQGFSPSAR